MTLSRSLVFVSLSLNLALLGAVVFTSSETSSAPSAPSALPAARTAPAAVAATTRNAISTAAAPKIWASIGTESLPALVDRLRAAGFPNSVIRAIVDQRFELRREELTLDGLDVPYWKNPTEVPLDPKVAAELAKLAKEHEEVLQQLLPGGGASGIDQEEVQAMQQRHYGNIPADKVAQLQEIQQRWGKRQTEIFNATRGTELGSQKIAQLQKEQHDEIARLLTPAQLLEFDLRQSPTSYRLRASLAGFNASESEFRALFSLYQTWDAQFPGNDGQPPTPEQMTARNAAQQQMQQQIKALLPPDRYVDYEQAARPGAHQINALVERLGLPLSAAAKVSAVQQDVQSRAAQIGRDPQLSPDERARQVAALTQEANTQIVAAIGTRGLAGYRQYGGQWLEQLQARATAPAGKQP